ncbi:MAG: nucleotide sugar dehydrogenase, partial [Flavobacteriaceae bacterium]
SQTVGGILKKGDLVIYESTVYPGVTEDECVPILEECSNLRLNLDFYVGYSPERINPGDKEHTVTKIKKVTSGSSPESSIEIDNLYKSIITAGTHLAPSIKVAEAAKVIENSQRDINIAFVNELSKIFNLLNLDTSEILEAAATKWNFLKFQPGLVGGHCIGVDPFYLSQKAQEVGYHPEIILAGRRINDSMGQFVATETIRLLINRNFKIKGAKILILGFTFKENCPDYRNTKVIDIHDELIKFSADVSIYEPEVSLENLNKDYNCRFIDFQNIELYDAIILAVPHKRFKKINWRNIINKNGVLYDVKSMLSKENSDGRL